MTSPLAAIRDPHCTICPLSSLGAKTICMSGSGPLNAQLVIVGEAPGYNEDREGKPFVGQAGQLLDDELARAGIRREDVFVTNSQRCRPPDNRKPTTAERKACKPYLEAELDLVKPRLVLATGNSAMQALLGSSGIMSKMNAVYEKDGLAVLPVLHPAAVLRDPTHMDAFRSGLALAKRVLDDTNKPLETKINLITARDDFFDLANLIQYCENPIAIDIETATTTGRREGGLEPWSPDWRLDTISFTWAEGESWVLPLEHPEHKWKRDVPVYLRLETALLGKRLVGHNIKFDLSGLRWRGVKARAHFDTMVAAHLLDENGQHGLKPLARQYLGAEAYKDDVKRDGTDPLDKLALYNGRDTDYTLRLYHIFRDRLLLPENRRLLRIFMLLSMPAVNVLTDVEMRGFPVDVARLKERRDEIDRKIGELAAEMLQYVPDEDKPKANWNRSNFLERFLFETLDLPVVDVTPTDKPSMDRDALYELYDAHPVVPVLLEYRKWAKWKGTYVDKWVRQLKQVGRARLYPNYKVTGTVTGRLSSNFQQVPRNNFIRGIIGAPKGKVLIEADFSQIELRIAAMVSGDPTMRRLYDEGRDLHMDMAVAITGKKAEEITKEERSRAKPVSFGFLYGMGYKSYPDYARAQYGLSNVTLEQAQHYRWTFFNRFPRLVDWHDRQRRLVQVLGYVDSPIGRRRRLPAIRSTDKDKAAEAERQAINSPVQGFASDLTLMAMIAVGNLVQSQMLDPGKCWMIGQVHDSIMFETDEDYAEEAGQMIKMTMETLPTVVARKFGYKMPVPIGADVSVHHWWGGDD